MNRSLRGKAFGVTVAALALSAFTAPAWADSIPAPSSNTGTLVSIINDGGTNSVLPAGPYADVYINFLSNTQALITVIADSPLQIGDGNTFGFNTSFTGTVSNFAWLGGTNTTSFSLDNNLPENVSQFGKFAYVVSDTGGASNSVSELQFTFTLSGSQTFAGSSVFDFLSLNSQNYDAVAHIFPPNGGLTGFAGENSLGTCQPGQCSQSSVPEPASLLLLGTGLGILGQQARRRIRRA